MLFIRELARAATPRVVSFEEQVSVLREGLAKLYQDEEDWSRAAQVLAGIDLDSGEGGGGVQVEQTHTPHQVDDPLCVEMKAHTLVFFATC